MSAWLEKAFGITLLDPWLLWLLALVPIAWWLRRRATAPAVTFTPYAIVHDGADLPTSPRVRFARLPRVLQALGLCVAVLALARPVERELLPRKTEGVDILLCLDASSSMAAKDLDPTQNRLAVATAAANAFISARDGDRIGLLQFAAYADLLCPLTLDHDAAQRVLEGIELVERDGPEDMTGIGNAVARAGQILRTSTAKSRVVVLLTDGEENVAGADAPEEIGPAQAATLCRESGVRVYTIAIGQGRLGAGGQIVPLDTSLLEGLAQVTDGAFFRAQNAESVAATYAHIDRLERGELEEARYDVREKFLPLLFAALALLVAARALDATWSEVLP